EGLCQAAGDLRPDSKFLSRLNDLPRRQGVNYTIIAGDRPVYYRYEANVLALAGNVLGERVSRVWGLRQIKSAVNSGRERLLNRYGESDGPVTLASARLS